MNRFVWNLRYDAPRTLPYGYFGQPQEYTEYTLPNDAIVGATPRRQPEGPLAVPGTYKSELMIDGQKYSQRLTLKADPRLTISYADLEQELALAQRIASGMQVTYDVFQELVSERKDMHGTELSKKVADIQNGTQDIRGLGPLNRDLTRIFEDVTGGDARPSSTAITAVDQACKDVDARLSELRALKVHVTATHGCADSKSQ